jgi:hypothetical protein
MIIDPADDEINILLPIAFMIFVAIILFIVGTAFSIIYFVLKKLNIIEGKFFEKVFASIIKVKEKLFSK